MKLLENRESSGRSRNFFTKFKLGKCVSRKRWSEFLEKIVREVS